MPDSLIDAGPEFPVSPLRRAAEFGPIDVGTESALQLVYLNRTDIDCLLDGPELVGWVRDAMVATSSGQAVLPLRQSLELGSSIGAVGIMPGYLASERAAGVKLVSLVPPATRKGSSHLGMMILYSEDGLEPLAILDGGYVTAIRTAAASALATDQLARRDASCMAILGAGEQARAHIAAIAEVRSLQEVRIWSRPSSFDRAEQLASEFRDADFAVKAVTSVHEAVRAADIICTTTASSTPILSGDQVQPGAHINLVGSSHSGAREVDTSLLLKGRIFVDFMGSAEVQAGEILAAIAEGAMEWADVAGEIGSIVLGRVHGRENAQQITIYKSLGIASQDIVTANRLYALACQRGIGQIVDL